MKVCDSCGQDDGKDTEVGLVKIDYHGYHYNHWTHKDKSNGWTIDLCPKCAGQLKDDISSLLKDYNASRT